MSDNTEQTDETVVASVTSGDTEAYAVLMKRYESKLHRYVTYLIHDPETANDVVQETFIKAFKNLRGFNDSYKFSSWIYRIAHNEAMNAIKRFGAPVENSEDVIANTVYDARMEELIDAGIMKKQVHECLDKLQPKYKEVIQLVYFEQLKYEEASDVLRIPTSTVGVWLSRAKSHLRDLCKEKGVNR